MVIIEMRVTLQVISRSLAKFEPNKAGFSSKTIAMVQFGRLAVTMVGEISKRVGDSMT